MQEYKFTKRIKYEEEDFQKAQNYLEEKENVQKFRSIKTPSGDVSKILYYLNPGKTKVVMANVFTRTLSLTSNVETKVFNKLKSISEY